MGTIVFTSVLQPHFLPPLLLHTHRCKPLQVQNNGYLALVEKVNGSEFIEREVNMIREVLANYGSVEILNNFRLPCQHGHPFSHDPALPLLHLICLFRARYQARESVLV
jgi:hypothetical protein